LIYIILVLGLMARIAAALFLENIIWPDEIFQSLEQAHRLVFGYGLIPWEYIEGLRSYLVPLILAVILYPFKYLTFSGSFVYSTIVRIVLCLMSASLIVFAYKYGKTFGNRLAGLIAAFLVAFWYEFVYFAPKALGDMFAVYLILPGLFFAERGLRDKRRGDLIWAGALLALGGMIRYQNLSLLVLPLIGAFFYGYKLTELKIIKAYVYAALLVLCAAGVLDLFIWGDLFHSLFYAFDFWLVQGRVTSSLLTPPGWYFHILWNMQGYLFPVLCGLALFALPRVKLLWAAMLFYFLFHLGIAHKEYRYLFLCWPLLMIAAAIGADRLITKISRPRARRAILAVSLLGLTAFSLYSAVNFTWGDLGYDSNYIDKRSSAWTVMRAHIRAYQYLSTRPDIRGVQDSVDNWHWSPGYYYLHKNVPIYFTPQVAVAVSQDRRVNYLLSRSLIVDGMLAKVAQLGDIYVYRKR